MYILNKISQSATESHSVVGVKADKKSFLIRLITLFGQSEGNLSSSQGGISMKVSFFLCTTIFLSSILVLIIYLNQKTLVFGNILDFFWWFFNLLDFLL